MLGRKQDNQNTEEIIINELTAFELTAASVVGLLNGKRPITILGSDNVFRVGVDLLKADILIEAQGEFRIQLLKDKDVLATGDGRKQGLGGGSHNTARISVVVFSEALKDGANIIRYEELPSSE